MYYTCYWKPSKSGTEYPLPSSAKKTDLERIEGIQDMIDQFEKEWKQKAAAKTVPSYFIIPYFQSISTLIPFVHVTYYSHKAKKRTKEDAEVSTMRGSSLQSSSNFISLRFAGYHHIQKGIPTALFEHNLIIFFVNTFH